jgi:hypothetical protein
MSMECGRCEISLRVTELIKSCDEKDCPFRRLDQDRIVGPQAKPLSELSFREMATHYSDGDE